MKKLAFLAIVYLAFYSACSSTKYVERTMRPIGVSDLSVVDGAGLHRVVVFTTEEAPVTLPGCSLKKVSVRRNDEGFRYLAFVEPDQTDKIVKKGQRVKLYSLSYFYSSTGHPQELILARLE